MRRANNWITIISATTGAIINVATHDARGWSAMGYGIYFGIVPLLALLTVLIASFFVSPLPRLAKLIIAIAVAYAVLLVVIILGTRPPWLAIFFPSGIWLLPLLVWNLLVQWFGRQSKASNFGVASRKNSASRQS